MADPQLWFRLTPRFSQQRSNRASNPRSPPRDSSTPRPRS